jgi:hypothetical protein
VLGGRYDPADTGLRVLAQTALALGLSGLVLVLAEAGVDVAGLAGVEGGESVWMSDEEEEVGERERREAARERVREWVSERNKTGNLRSAESSISGENDPGFSGSLPSAMEGGAALQSPYRSLRPLTPSSLM